MKLTLGQRIQILQIIPNKGDIKTLRIVKDLESKLTITQEEIVKYEFTVTEDGKNYTWNKEGVLTEIDYELSELEISEVKKALQKLEEAKELQKNMLELYDKFIS